MVWPMGPGSRLCSASAAATLAAIVCGWCDGIDGMYLPVYSTQSKMDCCSVEQFSLHAGSMRIHASLVSCPRTLMIVSELCLARPKLEPATYGCPLPSFATLGSRSMHDHSSHDRMRRTLRNSAARACGLCAAFVLLYMRRPH